MNYCRGEKKIKKSEKIKKNEKIKNEKIKKNKIYEKKEYKCEKCGTKISYGSKMCVECNNLSQRRVERPKFDQLKMEVESLGLEGTGRKYGVTGNTIKKWIKRHKEN